MSLVIDSWIACLMAAVVLQTMFPIEFDGDFDVRPAKTSEPRRRLRDLIDKFSNW